MHESLKCQRLAKLFSLLEHKRIPSILKVMGSAHHYIPLLVYDALYQSSPHPAVRHAFLKYESPCAHHLQKPALARPRPYQSHLHGLPELVKRHHVK